MEHAQQWTRTQWQRLVSWVTREEHRTRAKEWRDQFAKAFTEHPHQTGETYLEHLWFTLSLTGRLLYSTTVLLIHGIFPFLLTRAASGQLERIYAIIKARVPKSRRDAIDIEWHL